MNVYDKKVLNNDSLFVAKYTGPDAKENSGYIFNKTNFPMKIYLGDGDVVYIPPRESVNITNARLFSELSNKQNKIKVTINGVDAKITLDKVEPNGVEVKKIPSGRKERLSEAFARVEKKTDKIHSDAINQSSKLKDSGPSLLD